MRHHRNGRRSPAGPHACAPGTATSGDVRVTGHLEVRARAAERKWHAHYVDRDGVKHTKVLGLAHVRDSGRHTARGAIVWRSGDGRCPDGSLTPKMAEDALAALLEDARRRPRRRPIATRDPEPAIPTFGDAVAQWLRYLRVEKGRSHERRVVDAAAALRSGAAAV